MSTTSLARRPSLASRSITWADAHYEETGKWPSNGSGPVLGAPGERWISLDMALREGSRDLPGGSSLSKTLDKRRASLRRNARQMTEGELMELAKLHKARFGVWPSESSGPVAGTSWAAIDHVLRFGSPVLPGGSSLEKFIAKNENGA